jgi:hypothetical protein
MTARDSDKLQAKTLLLAFNEIQRRGSENNGRYQLGQLYGEIGHDGYTVTISDEQVSVTVGFHNSLSVNTRSKLAVQQFRERVEALVAAAR